MAGEPRVVASTGRSGRALQPLTTCERLPAQQPLASTCCGDSRGSAGPELGRGPWPLTNSNEAETYYRWLAEREGFELPRTEVKLPTILPTDF